MVDERAADGEGVAEVHGGHGGERVDVFAAHPHALCVIVAHCVEETVLFGEEARRHAGVEDEGHEGEEVGEGHSASDGRKGGVRGRDEVVPRDEAVVWLSAVVREEALGIGGRTGSVGKTERAWTELRKLTQPFLEYG